MIVCRATERKGELGESAQWCNLQRKWVRLRATTAFQLRLIGKLVCLPRYLFGGFQCCQRASGAMERFRAIRSAKGFLCNCFFLFTIWTSSFQDAEALDTPVEAISRISPTGFLADAPKSVLFDPIEISPAVIPHDQYPTEPMSPMYPSFPTTYKPVLTGKCPVNFSAISTIMDQTASDCSAPLAPVLGNVICCPQVNSLLHVFQGHYSSSSNQLVLQKAVASDCFSDIISILASKGANSSIPALCSTKFSNLTGGSCPVKDVTVFERKVDTRKLLDVCSSIDPLKECCRPVCQSSIVDAAFRITGQESSFADNVNIVQDSAGMDVLNDCKGVVYSWLSRKLSSDVANNVFRILSACKVNKVCPLTFKQPLDVIKACRDLAAPNPSCCSSLNTYIAELQKQMLITNRQAINCATMFGSILQKGGVMTNIYELCDVDLKDFSLQLASGHEGCLLRSLPSDLIIDNVTGFSLTCDLNDNIAAPWPSTSSMSLLPLCAPEMSLPALPTSNKNSGSSGYCCSGIKYIASIFSFFVISLL